MNLPSRAATSLNAPVERLSSLDAFRGITIAAMIVVNSPGSPEAVYSQLCHADWNGWTAADCIFPFFLFIVGVSMALSFARRGKRGAVRAELERQVVKRTVILFALGLFLNAFPFSSLSNLRIPGVLQKIALCYLVASFIVLRTGVFGQVLSLVAVLAGYWLMMEFIPVPGIGAGVYEPGRSFAAYVDSLLLEGHMWARYETWDPEGLVSTIPAIGSTLFGSLTGIFLLSSSLSAARKAVLMLVGGSALLGLGEILAPWLPINKHIWTSTFAVFMAGWALILLGLVYGLMDVKGIRGWAKPFTIFGVNSIGIYVLSEILYKALHSVGIDGPDGTSLSLRDYLFDTAFLPLAAPVDASLLFALAYLLVLFAIAWIMWKNGWIIKI